jgi:hypothetical protein
MPLDDQMHANLQTLMTAQVHDGELANFLVVNSNLPGARANLEFVDAMATATASGSRLK